MFEFNLVAQETTHMLKEANHYFLADAVVHQVGQVGLISSHSTVACE